jgi:hypothetical protein
MQQRHKEQRPKRAATSGKQENTQQDFQEGSRAGDREAKIRIFTENECQHIVEWSGPLRNERRDCTQSKSTGHSRQFWLHRPEEGPLLFASCGVSWWGKKDDDCTFGPARTLSGSRSWRADLSRKLQEQLESKHCANENTRGRWDEAKLESKHRANWATARNMRPSINAASTALGKKIWRYAYRPFGTNSLKEGAM